MRRITILFLTQVLLWVLVSQANHALSGLHVYLFCGALYVIYAALVLPFREGLIVCVLSGLLCDANMPIAPSVSRLALGLAHTHLLLFLLAHTVIFSLRDRLPREETMTQVLVALLTNLAMLLLFSLIHTRHALAPAQVWRSLLPDLVFSQVCLALAAPWFFSLQERSLVLAGMQRESLANSP
jgi:hypothetical protein